MSRRWTLLLVAVMAVAGMAMSAGILIARQPVPDSLAGAQALTVVPISKRDFTDTRSVTMTVTPGTATPVLSPQTGRITAASIEAGQSISSGDRIIDIDGARIIALATSVPLWRSLERDMRGADVDALQSELARLGYDVWDTGVMDWSTRFAAADLLGMEDGYGGVPDSIPHDRFVWIPSATTTVETVDAEVGQPTDDTKALFTLAAVQTRVTIQIPDGALEGERDIALGDAALPVDASGEVDDLETIAAILASPQYAAAKETAKESGTVSLQLEWSLREPITVTVVPPGALFGLSGSTGCVAHDGVVVPVRIVTSQVGQTYVVPDSDIDSVDLNVEGLACP